MKNMPPFKKKVRKRRGFSVQSAQNLLSAFFATNLMHAYWHVMIYTGSLDDYH